ncbi:type IX secretion system protein PorQ [Bacteroidota bacterium]
MNFILTFLIIISVSNIYSQNTFEFLRLDPSPRAASLAGSYVANDDDPNVIFYNPAGISLLSDIPVSFSYLSHLLDINSASIAGSYEIESIGRFAAGIQYINYGDFTQADQFGNKLGEFGAGELAMLVGYSNQLDTDFYYGANVKFIYSSIADRSSAAFALDLGLHYAIPDSKWNFGFSILNIGSQVSSYFDEKEDLPMDIRAGVSKELEHMPFRFYFSFNKLNEDEGDFFTKFRKFTFGGEFRLSKAIKLRLGYDNEKRKELKIGTTAGLSGFSLGVGINVSDYFVDYSFSSMGSIGSLHRIGITTTLIK